MLDRFDEVQAVMLPSVRRSEQRLFALPPIHPRTGIVMQVPVLEHDLSAGAIRWRDSATGEEFETLMTNGRCQLQWNPDWAIRWYTLGVGYEDGGKGLIGSVGCRLVSRRFSERTRLLGSITGSFSTRRTRSFENEGQRPDN